MLVVATMPEVPRVEATIAMKISVSYDNHSTIQPFIYYCFGQF